MKKVYVVFQTDGYHPIMVCVCKSAAVAEVEREKAEDEYGYFMETYVVEMDVKK